MARLGPNAKVVAVTGLIAAGMGGLSFAAVPFYSWFCQTTGFAGTTSKAEAAPGEVLDQLVEVRFDSSTEPGMPVQFRPMQTKMSLRIGETGIAFFEAYNPTDKPVGSVATFNVSPDEAGGYFTKIQCFCFDEQVLQPHERVQMPVTFFVDPAIIKDEAAKGIRQITLSYTFFQADLPQTQASLDPGLTSGQNTANN
jgi:cytochrome c oxidase assembly protein subunit 11